MISNIDRIIFLKEVPFFQNMTIDQLKVLAAVCEESFFEQGASIVKQGDLGGVLYMVVNGRVGIEHEKRAGSFVRLADLGAYVSFGEANFFDNSPHSNSAVAISDTLVLQLRREPLIELARQNPNLALQLINFLSQRLREESEKVAGVTRSQPSALNKLYDQFN